MLDDRIAARSQIRGVTEWILRPLPTPVLHRLQHPGHALLTHFSRVLADVRFEAHVVGITGASGYLGRALSARLIERGHQVRALVRSGGTQRVVAGVQAIELDVFDVAQLARGLQGCEAVVHLIGTPNPNPSKAQEFRRVDLGSALACIAAASAARIAHFVYVSVAQPAPLMHTYVAARAEAERALAAAHLTATVLRPWYVLGPGHRWPIILVPFYALAELFPGWRESARRTALVTLAQITDALTRAIEQPPAEGAQHIVDVPQIRKSALR